MRHRDSIVVVVTLAVLIGLIPLLLASSLPKIGTQATWSRVVTKSASNYFPATGGIRVDDSESFGAEVYCIDASGDNVDITWHLQTSFDETNWVTYTETVFYGTHTAGAATISMTGAANRRYHASVHPMPVPYIRLNAVEAAGQDDVTCTLRVFGQ